MQTHLTVGCADPVCTYVQLASIRKLYHELDGQLKAIKATIFKLQEEVRLLLCLDQQPWSSTMVISRGEPQ